MSLVDVTYVQAEKTSNIRQRHRATSNGKPVIRWISLMTRKSTTRSHRHNDVALGEFRTAAQPLLRELQPDATNTEYSHSSEHELSYLSLFCNLFLFFLGLQWLIKQLTRPPIQRMDFHSLNKKLNQPK